MRALEPEVVDAVWQPSKRFYRHGPSMSTRWAVSVRFGPVDVEGSVDASG